MWSVGLTIYELITLHHAFAEDKSDTFTVLKNIIEKEPFEIKDGLCSSELREIVMRLLSKKGRNRPTAKELKEKLLFCLEKERKKLKKEMKMDVTNYDMIYPPSLITGK
jgi:serine/threonine protein kinase